MIGYLISNHDLDRNCASKLQIVEFFHLWYVIHKSEFCIRYILNPNLTVLTLIKD